MVVFLHLKFQPLIFVVAYYSKVEGGNRTYNSLSNKKTLTRFSTIKKEASLKKKRKKKCLEIKSKFEIID